MRLNQSRSNVATKGEIHGRGRRKERFSRSKLKQAFLIVHDAEFSCILFNVLGSALKKFGVMSRFENVVFANVLSRFANVLVQFPNCSPLISG